MNYEGGDLVLRVTEEGTYPARVLIGPHTDGEFDIVVLVDPEHWPDGPAGGTAEDYWGEWMYAWPVECLLPHPENETMSPDSV